MSKEEVQKAYNETVPILGDRVAQFLAPLVEIHNLAEKFFFLVQKNRQLLKEEAECQKPKVVPDQNG